MCADHLGYLSLHKPALLQLVDDRHQTALVHVKHLSQSLLANTQRAQIQRARFGVRRGSPSECAAS